MGALDRPLKIVYKRPYMFPYQAEFMDGPERFTVIEGATKVGKTTPLIVWLFEQSLKLKDGQNCWWVAPIYAQAKIAFKRMQKFCKIKAGANGKPFFTANKADLTLTTPNGAVIMFKSAENPDGLYGEDVYACVFDEASRAHEDAWTAIRSTLTSTGGKCKFIANVRGRGWYWKLAQKAKTNENPDYKHFKVNCWDAVCTGNISLSEVIKARVVLEEHGVYERLKTYAKRRKKKPTEAPNRLPLSEILSAESDLPKHVFKELYEAEVADDGTNPFGKENIDKAVGKISTLKPVCYGIDLASKRDYTVIIGLDINKRVCYFKRFKIDWTLTTEIIKTLPDIPISIDATGVGDPIVKELQKRRKYMVGEIFSAPTKQRLMEGLAVAFQRNEIGILDNKHVLYRELESFEFSYTRTGGVRYEAPSGHHDDTVMSLALAYSAYQERKLPVKSSQATVPTNTRIRKW